MANWHLSDSTTAKLRVENLHYELTEEDLDVGRPSNLSPLNMCTEK